jgi:UPF0176 protein
MFDVLLYYKMILVQHPDVQTRIHKEICRALQLKGRVLIGKDGINGTVSGIKSSVDLYVAYMNQHQTFCDIDFKKSSAGEHPFSKLSVKARTEIITTDDRENFDLCRRGKHIDRDTFHQWLVDGEDMVLLDMRNDYEWEIGRFVGSVRPPMKYFRDLKDSMDFYEQFKNKRIVMFCTGGIRCEPASAQFIAHGFDPKQIYQLEGGIVTYAEKYGNEGFYEGKCFVFDDRIAVPVNTSDSAKIVGTCIHCGASNDLYRNCLNRHCNRLYLACHGCNSKTENTCSDECREIICESINHRSPRRKVIHRNK